MSVPARDRSGRLLGAALYGGTAAAAFAAPPLARRLRRRRGRLAPVADLAVQAAVVGGGWAAIALCERRRPFRAAWNRANDDVAADLTSLVVVGGAAQVAVGAAVATAHRTFGSPSGPRRAGRLPAPVALAVSLTAYDLAHTTFHRILHERAGWRFHAVHHAPERLYWLNATRFHLVEMVLDGVLEQTVLGLLGIDGDAAVRHRVFRGLFGQIQHGNVAIDSGALNAVLSTPERHRWHHSTSVQEGNSNYGAVVCLWDRAFGSGFLPEHPFDGTVGLGVAGD